MMTNGYEESRNKVYAILRELGCSEDDLFYILGHCQFSIYSISEPYKTDVLQSLVDLYEATKKDIIFAIGWTEEQYENVVKESAISWAKRHDKKG